MQKFTSGNHQHGITDTQDCDHPLACLKFPFKASLWHDPCQEETGGECPDQDPGLLRPQQGEGAAGGDWAPGDSSLNPQQPNLSRNDQQVPWILIPKNVDIASIIIMPTFKLVLNYLHFIYTSLK